MQKFMELLEKSEKGLRTVDHIVYVTFPLVKDKRLLLKAVSDMKEVVLNCINSILYYEYIHKKIFLYKNFDKNFQVFVEKCSGNYGITKEEISLIKNLFDIAEKHQQSGFEFFRRGKIVILSEDLKAEVITLEKIKVFLIVLKNILKKTKTRFLSKI